MRVVSAPRCKRLGPRGLAAAAGIGVMVAALAVAINKAREARVLRAARRRRRACGHIGEQAGDASGCFRRQCRVGRRGEHRARAASRDDRMMRCREARRRKRLSRTSASAWNGCPRNGGDTVDVLMKIAQHGGLTAGQLNDRSRARSATPWCRRCKSFPRSGCSQTHEFDALTKQDQRDERPDRTARSPDERAADTGRRDLPRGRRARMRRRAGRSYRLVFCARREANAMFWQRLRQASMKDWLWGDPIKDAMNARNEELARLQKQQEDFKAIVAGHGSRSSRRRQERADSLCRIDQPADTEARRRAAGRRKAAGIRRLLRQGDHPDRRPVVLPEAPAEAAPFPGPRSLSGSRRRHREAQRRPDGVAAARMAAIVRPADRADRAGPRRGDQGARRARAVRGAARAGGVD